MKKVYTMISMTLIIGSTMIGCATSGDLERVQAQDRATSAKADQALQDAQVAKAAADAAALKADAAAARAENAVKMAEERESKAAKAEAAFQKSMKK
jgi:murein lipoprotein